MADDDERAQPASLEGHIQNLVRKLNLAKEIQPPSHVPEGRARHVLSLLSVSDFFAEALGEKDLADQFAYLAMALNDLDTGTVHDLLKPDRGEHSSRPGDPSQIWLLRAKVCLAHETLINSGLSRGAAASKIEKAHPGLKALMNAKSEKLSKSILSWASQFKKGGIKNDIAQHAFSENLQRLRAIPPLPEHVNEVTRLLKDCEQMAAQLARS